MDKKIYFSIIMPSYNSEKTLENAITSIMRQEYRYFELIIVDDGSTDNSCDIAERIAKSDKRIRVYKMKKNLGAPHCLNTGVNLALFEWISVVDSDAIEPRGWLHTAAKNVDKEFEILGGCVSYEKDRQNKYFKEVFYYIENFSVHKDNMEYGPDNFYEPNIMGTNFFFTKNVFRKVKGFKEKYRAVFERLFICNAVEIGFKAKYVKSLYVEHPLYNYSKITDIFKRAYVFSTWRVAMLSESILIRRNYTKLNIFMVTTLLLLFLSYIVFGFNKTCLFISITAIVVGIISFFALKASKIPVYYIVGYVYIEFVKKLIGTYVYIFNVKPNKLDWKQRT